MRRPASHKYPAGREKDKWGSSEPAQVAVLEAGGVQAALSLLQMDGSSAIVKALATRLLAELSCSAQGATALYNDDAVPILAPLLRAGARSDTAEHAARALCNMSRLDPIPIEASCMVRITAAAPELVTLLWDAREVAQDVTNLGAPDVTNLILLLTGTLENLAGEQQSHEALCKAGAVAALMATLGDDTTAPQYHRVAYHSALLALSDMAKLGTAATATVILAAVVERGLPQEFTASPHDPFAAALKSKLLTLAMHTPPHTGNGLRGDGPSAPRALRDGCSETLAPLCARRVLYPWGDTGGAPRGRARTPRGARGGGGAAGAARVARAG